MEAHTSQFLKKEGEGGWLLCMCNVPTVTVSMSCNTGSKCRLSNNFSRLTYKFSRVFEPLKTENRPVPTHIFSVQQAAPFSHNQGCANSPFHNEAKIYE